MEARLMILPACVCGCARGELLAEREHRRQIELQDGMDVRQVDVFRRAAHDAAGVVDQDVHPAGVLRHLPEELGQILNAGHIKG